MEGWNTACKLLFPANFGLGADLTMDDVAVEGIQSVTAAMFGEWRRADRLPKLGGDLWYGSSDRHVGFEDLGSFARPLHDYLFCGAE
jgi:homoserine dehydrogenase